MKFLCTDKSGKTTIVSGDFTSLYNLMIMLENNRDIRLMHVTDDAGKTVMFRDCVAYFKALDSI